MRYLLLLFVFTSIGCTLTHTANVKLTGNNIKTVYGTGDVNSEYTSNTTWGFLNGNSIR